MEKEPTTILVAIKGQYDLINGKQHYIPCQIVEGKPGYIPMRGGPDQLPWYWGTSFAECQKTCDDYNIKHGISKKDAAEIKRHAIESKKGE